MTDDGKDSSPRYNSLKLEPAPLIKQRVDLRAESLAFANKSMEKYLLLDVGPVFLVTNTTLLASRLFACSQGLGHCQRNGRRTRVKRIHVSGVISTNPSNGISRTINVRLVHKNEQEAEHTIGRQLIIFNSNRSWWSAIDFKSKKLNILFDFDGPSEQNLAYFTDNLYLEAEILSAFGNASAGLELSVNIKVDFEDCNQ